MAKRYTETEQWDLPWFHQLTKEQKLFWLYIHDKCNIAGVWGVNWNYVEHALGVTFIEYSVYGPRVKLIDNGDKWFICDFVLKQQGIKSLGELNPKNMCHASIIKILKYENIIGPITGPLYSNGNSKTQPYTTTKDSENNKTINNGIQYNSYYNRPTQSQGNTFTDYSKLPKEAPIDWFAPGKFEELVEETQSFLKLSFKPERIKELFLSREVPEVLIDKAMLKLF